jgi:predicted RNase H-like HicB family nuclease
MISLLFQPAFRNLFSFFTGLNPTMETRKIVVWQHAGAWLGYLQEYPDYWTQGDTLEELRENLKDLYSELSGGMIDGARHVEDLVVS